jgi:serine/threonine-protein kinase
VSLRLTVTKGPGAGRAYVADRAGAFLVGRSARAQFQFPSGPKADLRISHIHCLIEVDSPRCRVHDLDSSNGVFVNGEPVDAAELKPGDKLRLGRSTISVQWDEELDTGTWAVVDAPSDDTITPEPRAPASKVRKAVCPACEAPREGPFGALCAACETLAAGRPQPIAGYRIVRDLPATGIGVVHLAVETGEGIAVALRTIDTSTAAPSQIARFLRGAEFLRRLRRRHIVALRHVATNAHVIYLASDFIRGVDTATQLKEQSRLAVSEAVRIICQLLSALHAAHIQGLVHRDIRPANLLIEMKPGRRALKVADFGLERLYHDARLGGALLPTDAGCATAFMAPEQVLDFRGATPAADQYSAAATLYMLLTGEPVYEQLVTVPAQFAQILDEEIVPIRDRLPGLPNKLITAIHRALARDPKRRFPDVGAFRDALKAFVT